MCKLTQVAWKEIAPAHVDTLIADIVALEVLRFLPEPVVDEAIDTSIFCVIYHCVAFAFLSRRSIFVLLLFHF